MKHAKISWLSGQPFNLQFFDIYFSRENGMAEKEYVFLHNNHLPERWRGKKQFVIAETGFGSGLNFLTTVHHWLKSSNDTACLQYIAIDKFPLSQEDLRQALSHWPQLNHLLSEFILHYPPAVPGFHHIPLFKHRVVLTFILGDVETGLKQMSANVDAWYLDGFSPEKNPEMWTKPVFQKIAGLSKKNTSFSTFTAAGLVRRGLSEVGFNVEKIKGYDQKREMLRGTFSKESAPNLKTPWFELPQSEDKVKHAIVVGGGIAGITTAWALAQRGWQIDLIEQREHIAQEGSGNPVGLLMPRISLDESPESQFYAAAFFKAIRQLRVLNNENPDIHWNQGGILQLASSARIKKQIDKLKCDPDFVQAVSSNQASKLAGIEIQSEALYFPMGGWLNPLRLCQSLIQNTSGRIKPHLNTRVQHLLARENQWQIYNQNHQLITASETLILANAVQATQFEAFDWLPLSPARGQMSLIPTTAASKNIRCAICYGGYILPATEGEHVIGATFIRGDGLRNLRQADQEKNQEKLEQHLPTVFDFKTQVLKGHAAVRALTPDRIPIVGPVPDMDFFKAQYHDIQKGKSLSTYPRAQYLKGLYLNVGHGTKGLTTSFLSAELLASQINNEPIPVSIKTQQALNPARFIIRAFKKSKAQS